MRKLFAILLFLAGSSACFAQENTTPTTVPYRSFFAELGGPGVLFSVNYDTRFKKSAAGLGARIGIGFSTGFKSNAYFFDSLNNYYYSTNGKTVSSLTIPVQVNYIFAKPGSKSAFEVGLGATYIGKYSDIFDFDVDPRKGRIYGNTSFMYRRLPTNGGFSWRVGFTPLIGNGVIQPSAAASIGFNF